MSKRYFKILMRFVKEWFELPKIIITTTIFIVFYSVMQLSFSKIVVISTILLVACYEMYVIWLNKKRQQKKQKVFLLESMIKQTSAGFTTLTFINAINFISIVNIEFNKLSLFWMIFWSALLTLSLIVSYIINIVLPEKAEDLLEEIYPEYKFL